ncbi:MAG: cytochrome-c peroxidase [Flavobacteriales bacterium]
MKYLTRNIIYCLTLVMVFMFSCKKDENKIDNITVSSTPIFGTYNPTYIQPKMLPYILPMHNPDFNKMTVEGVALGRKLYYDKILSTNNRSCSSCHLPQYSFSLPFIGPIGTAILPHVNLGWYNKYGWEGGEDHLDYVALADLAEGNPFLNANADSIDSRFKRSTEYQQMFWSAFGVSITTQTDSVRKNYISFALAQFLRSMVSNDAKFDKYLRGEVALTAQELSGFNVFVSENKGDCFHCHGTGNNPMWSDLQFHNNALNSTFSGVDLGRYNVTGNPSDIGKFKTPTLRNIALSAPYMHDNRFATLEEVVDFYSEGLQQSSYVDPLMQKIGQGGTQLTVADKADLVAFLKTLTDSTFINNPDFLTP